LKHCALKEGRVSNQHKLGGKGRRKESLRLNQEKKRFTESAQVLSGVITLFSGSSRGTTEKYRRVVRMRRGAVKRGVSWSLARSSNEQRFNEKEGEDHVHFEALRGRIRDLKENCARRQGLACSISKQREREKTLRGKRGRVKFDGKDKRGGMKKLAHVGKNSTRMGTGFVIEFQGEKRRSKNVLRN